MAGYIGSKSSGIISGIDASIAELNLNDKASANGTTEANKVLTADANKDVTAIRNLTATGDVAAGGWRCYNSYRHRYTRPDARFY